MRMKKEKSNIANIISLHICIIIYSISTVLIKKASYFDMLSLTYILFMVCSVAVLGIYALLWQQVIKKFNPSVAYSNKSITTLWTLAASAIFFGETIRINNIIGAFIIIVGVILVAQEH